ITMTRIAHEHGLTKAAISKRTKEIRRELHLSINANNKSPNASHRYSQTNRSPLRVDESAGRLSGVPARFSPSAGADIRRLDEDRKSSDRSRGRGHVDAR